MTSVLSMPTGSPPHGAGKLCGFPRSSLRLALVQMIYWRWRMLCEKLVAVQLGTARREDAT